MAALSADRFARFSAYAGRSSLDTFVALTVRDLMAARMLRLLHADRMKALTAFERIPCAPRSTAYCRISATTAALATA